MIFPAPIRRRSRWHVEAQILPQISQTTSVIHFQYARRRCHRIPAACLTDKRYPTIGYVLLLSHLNSFCSEPSGARGHIVYLHTLAGGVRPVRTINSANTDRLFFLTYHFQKLCSSSPATFSCVCDPNFARYPDSGAANSPIVGRAAAFPKVSRLHLIPGRARNTHLPPAATPRLAQLLALSRTDDPVN